MAINATDAGTSHMGVTAEASPGVAPGGIAAVDPSRGLTDAEAAARRARGQGHQLKPETGRTYPQMYPLKDLGWAEPVSGSAAGRVVRHRGGPAVC